jgi:hypothetical protein
LDGAYEEDSSDRWICVLLQQGLSTPEVSIFTDIVLLLETIPQENLSTPPAAAPKTGRSVVPLVVLQHTQALDSNLIHGAKGCLMRVRPRRSIRTSNSSTPGQGRA